MSAHVTVLVGRTKKLSLIEMTFYGLVHVSFTLPEWQAVKLTFFAP